MQETQPSDIQDNEKLQNLDNILQQLEVETFEVESIADMQINLAGGTCSSTTSSTTSKF